MERSREAGFDHHLVKPLDMETLKNLITRFRDESGLFTTAVEYKDMNRYLPNMFSGGCGRILSVITGRDCRLQLVP